MSALTQYIELFRQHKPLIDANGAGPLNDLREKGYEILSNAVLPREGSDNYENVDLDAMLAPDYGLNVARVDMDVNPAATFRCDVPIVSSTPFLLINDTFAETSESRIDLPEGVEVGSLRSFALNYPDRIKEFYGKCADISNPMVALDTMLAQDGFYLRIHKGVKLTKPLQLINILQNGSPLMAVRRVLIIVEEDAAGSLVVCDHTQNPEIEFLALETVEIFAGKSSRFEYYNLEESTAKTNRISALYLSQKEGSNVVIDGVTLYNGNTRNEYYCRFEGEECSLRLLGMGIEDDKRRISTYTRISHDHPRCKSDELFKFTVDDEARAAFTGRIYVAPGAVKTEAYQSNRNIVGSDGARMQSRPELEIYNDDVKCSHGCATGQLDSLQMFYMRTRGLDENTARLLLKQAFMADIIDAIDIDALRERLHLLVERRFAGASSACASCAACRKGNEIDYD